MSKTSISASTPTKGTIFDVYPIERLNQRLFGDDPKFLARMNALTQHTESIISNYNAAISGSDCNAD